jgi:hypothetical protein
MNKVFLAAALILGLTVSASALTTLDETHNGKTVAVPGATKSAGVYAPAAQYTPHGLVVTAPPGADVDVDNDGSDISIDITPKGKQGLLGLGVLGL